MVSNSLLLVILFSSLNILSLCVPNAAQIPPPKALIFPIKKDNATLQYYTSMDMGSPFNFFDLVIDLGGQFLWLDCSNYNFSSYRPIRCGSSKCKAAKGSGCISCNAPSRPGCTNKTCSVFPYNPINNLLELDGLGEDVMTVDGTDGIQYVSSADVPDFPFSCVGPDSSLLGSLSNHTIGMAGFARTKTSLPVKLTSALKLSPKFALCIPSSAEWPFGDIFIGGGPYYMLPYGDMSKSLTTTPLIINPVSTAAIYSEGDPSDEYFIDVKSIKVSGKVVAFNSSLLAIDKKGVGGTKLSTVAPYTVLHTSIYNALIKEFVKKAAIRKIKRVKSIAPFGACFSSKTIESTRTGPKVPNIDLVMQSEDIYWRIYGSNSMVKVKKDVLCLGFIDGGTEPRTSIILGGHQLENILLEFDLASSKLGFSSSLLVHNVTCSQQRLF